MKPSICALVLTGALLAAAATPAASQESVTVTLGLGAALAPAYLGSDEVSVRPSGALAIEELVPPGGFGIGSDGALPIEPGFGPRGGFRYLPAREGSDFPELEGLDDIGQAFEIGAGLVRVTRLSRAYAEVRKGFGGHHGWVAEAGVDALLRPAERLVLSAGPRVYLGDAAFMRTYFGVTPEESARSGLGAYRPDGGLVSLGVELTARYDLGGGWRLHGTLDWRRLQEEAADSPITRQGSADQYRARLIVARTFALR